MSRFGVALCVSLFLHVAVVVTLVISGYFTLPKAKPETFNPEPIIQAKVIDESVLRQQAQKVKDEQKAIREKEERRLREIERRAKDAEKKRQRQELDKKNAEQAAVAARDKQKREKAEAKQLEDDRKRKEIEKKKADDLAKQAKEKREKEQKALKEAERKRQEAIAKAEQEKLLDEQLQAEQAVRQQERNKQVLSEKQKYQGLVYARIKLNMAGNDKIEGKKCLLNIKLASNGFVTQVKVIEGDPVLCRIAENAVWKAEELPVSSDPAVFEDFRNFELLIEPKK